MLPTRDRGTQPTAEPVGSARRSVGWLLLLVAPGLWVMAILGLGFALHIGVQLIPLLAAAPAIACAGTGRKVCVVLGSACALIALTPIPGLPISLGERIGSASAVLTVTLASYIAVNRRIRIQQAYDQVRQIAEVTQRVLLRPIPERIGPVTAAVEYLSAATGARIGGDFYEVIDTPYGVRAILGDMRGHGLDAVSGASALLGTFREAGAVEPTLEAVAARLDAALTRHTLGSRRAELIGGWGEAKQREVRGEPGARVEDERQLWAEDFATAVLVQVPYGRNGQNRRTWHGGAIVGIAASAEIDGAGMNGISGVNEGGRAGISGSGVSRAGIDGGGASGSAGGGDGAWRGVGTGDLRRWHGCGADEAILETTLEARLVVCGHPAPYLIHDGQALPIVPERATLPLGLGWLLDEPYAPSSSVVPFEAGDALVFYTDGVSDARARSGEFFQLEGLLCDDLGDHTPEYVAAAIRSRLLEHMRHELNDDAALLVLGRLGVDN